MLHQISFAGWRDVVADYCINYRFRYLFRDAFHYDHLLTV